MSVFQMSTTISYYGQSNYLTWTLIGGRSLAGACFESLQHVRSQSSSTICGGRGRYEGASPHPCRGRPTPLSERATHMRIQTTDHRT